METKKLLELRKYVVIIILIAVVIVFRDIFINIVNVFFNLVGMKGIESISPSFIFMIIAILFFGFALVVAMVLTRKKALRKNKDTDIVSIGECEICFEKRARNILPMNYKEGDKRVIINVCENCRKELKELDLNREE